MHWRDLFTSTRRQFISFEFSIDIQQSIVNATNYTVAKSFIIILEHKKLLDIHHIIILFSSTFYKKGHVIRRNLKIPNARVSRFVDWCAVMTLESFSCVFCQSKEFDRVTDWLTDMLTVKLSRYRDSHRLWTLSNSYLIPITHIIWIFDWDRTINSQCYKLHCG
jgi:hypothetical protein